MRKALDRIDKMEYRTMVILTLVFFIISCIVRSVFACYPKSIHVHPDEIRYLDIARSLFNGDGVVVHNVRMNFDSILYPLFLMPFNLIKDQLLQITWISIGNSILISSVIIPVFLLGQKILKRNAAVLLLLLTVLTLPDLSMSITFMSENLFYPLAAWLIYFVFQFWSSERIRTKFIYCILCAFFCLLAYLTKVVAVYFIAGFLVALGFDCLFTKSNSWKHNIIYGFFFGATATGLILGYKLLILILWGSNAATYSGNLRLSVYDFNTFIYFFYANLYNLMFALIAFFFFPVVMPMFRFKKLEKSEKNLLVFALVSLLVMIVIITTSISLNEDYPKLYMRQHTRYYAPLLIIFLTLFFKEHFVPKEDEELSEKKPIWPLTAFTVFFCMIVFSLFRFFSNVCIDGVLLQAISSIGKSFTELTGDINQFNVAWQLILAKCLVVLVVIVFTVILVRDKTKKIGSRVLIVLIIAISLLNNYFSMKEFRDVYGDAPSLIAQAISINDYLLSNSDNGTVLIITDGYAPILDTYISDTAYWTTKSKVLEQLDKQEYIDLSAKKIVSNYPFIDYEDLNHVDYVVTDHSVTINLDYYEKLDISGLSRYSVYKALDPSKLYLESN
jgi:hypothetical protein